jgi:MFS family permease
MAKKRLFMDIRPLRESPHFRRLWVGTGLSTLGTQMTRFAVALQVYTLTGSSLAVGSVGIATVIPSILFGLVGGAVADAVDRRKLVLLTTGGLAVVSVVFAAQAFAELGQLWLLYVLVAVQSVLTSLNSPARRTFNPRLLRPDQLPAAAALMMFTFHVSSTAGPALAGLFAALWGLKVLYLIDALTFVATLYGVFRLPGMKPEGGTTRPGLRSIGEGIGYVRRNKVLSGAFLADLNATVLAMPFALFPAINAEHFGGAAQTLGLLTAAPAVGGLLGSALSGRIGDVARPGRAMLITGMVWGASLAGFGLVPNLWLALALLAVAGVADSISMIFSASIVQVATPDRYRGRVSAAEFVIGTGGPQLGNFRAGVVGSLTSSAVSAVSGGLSCVVGAALVWVALPAFTRYRAPRDEVEQVK